MKRRSRAAGSLPSSRRGAARAAADTSRALLARDLAATWMPRLLALSDRLRRATRGELLQAVRARSLASVSRTIGYGAGDVTYGLDAPAERELARWLAETGRRAPLSLLTEESGWRHVGPGPRGKAVELPGFDHGGPRIVVDPVDGTRVLMTDLRPAWSVIALAGAGETGPRLSDVALGVLAEIPDSRAASFRRFHAWSGGGCRFEERGIQEWRPGGGRVRARRAITADDDDRADEGFFPFFRYAADQRPALAAIEAAFFARLAAREGAQARTCYDDQYTSNGGQLAFLALGSYRMIADLRAWQAARRRRKSITSKPYDVAGAILCAREAGCVVEAADGGELDFPLDAETPISFVGWANAGTRKRLRPHLDAAMRRRAR